ncbi:MAG: ABC transporter permease subunit [Thermomicrobiales bacterium]|nr:ABC transporter permease subunit [Thermomicrobiales bacterium]
MAADAAGAFAPPQPEQSFGEVYDRGYQHYEGQRLGRRQAFWALTVYSMKRALGSKKRWTAKVVPALMYVAIGLLVAIPLGIRAFVDELSILEYWDYFDFTYVILAVYLASVAPEMLCNDRRENVLPLYFARALTRADYLMAKLLSTTLLTLTVTLLPMGIYWLGQQLLEDSPLPAMKDNIGDLGRIIVLCVVVSLFLAAITLVISSLTGRKSIAAAGIVLALLVLPVISFGIAESGVSDRAAGYALLFNPIALHGEFAYGLFGERSANEEIAHIFPTEVYGGVMLIAVALCCLVMFWRYVQSD